MLTKGDSTSFLCMNAMNKDTLNHYFDLLEETMKENNLLNSPTKVYNVDETGIPQDPKTPKVITIKETKKVRYHSTGRKGQITVVACGNAAQASNSGCIDAALDSVLDVARDTSLDPLDSHFDTYSQIECEGSILQEFSDVRPLSPIKVVSIRIWIKHQQVKACLRT